MDALVIALLALTTFAAVARPFLRSGTGDPLAEPTDSAADGDRVGALAAIEAEIARYRDALSAGTLCRRCGQANPPGSRFCCDCGRSLTPGRSARSTSAAES
ncbi:MAG: zinc ribbon domain-containing protein [Gemmatimonadetes bacterium]|nr:zinc ribbon domain-containing protein [Gemmatimonadota bacterium]